MSVEAALTVYLGEYRIVDIVGVYLKRGMRIFDRDDRAYICTSDDFEYLSVTLEELAAIIEDRERRGELVCVYLYENGEPVTSLLKSASDELSVSCDINRKTLANRHTDVNYYIEKFVEPLEADGFAVEGFKFWELR